MNRFDEKYDIRFAFYDEIDEVMSFIEEYWKKGHILARDRDFFEYEMVTDKRVNFVIAKDKQNGRICGLHGFIPASKDGSDGWASIWKVAPGAMGLLGLEIAKRMEQLTQMRILSIGANAKTALPHMRFIRKFECTGRLRHFYCVSKKENYKIAVINQYISPIWNEEDHTEVRCIHSFGELSNSLDIEALKMNPYKDEWYIKHRYFDYPYYTYQCYLLSKDGRVGAAMICREQEHDGEKALRIVDYIGNIELFDGISDFLRAKLEEYEYIDFYCYGVDTAYICKAGMTERKENDVNIIPNYFFPYLPENVEIWFGIPKGKATFFKADGDQDRPV